MRDIRFREPSYLDDPEVADYLGSARRAPRAERRRRAPGLRVLRDARPHDQRLRAARRLHRRAHRAAAPPPKASPRSPRCWRTKSRTSPSATSRACSASSSRCSCRCWRRSPRRSCSAARAPTSRAARAAAARRGAVQTQLSYSRDFEREADRIGFQALEGAGLRRARDGARSSRRCSAARASTDDGTLPGYLRTHPVTTERIADAQNRAAQPALQAASRQPGIPPGARQAARRDRATRATRSTYFAGARCARGATPARRRRATAWRARCCARGAPRRPRPRSRGLRAAGAAGPMVETLAARVRLALGDPAGAATLLGEAHARYPHSRPLLYAHVDALQEAGRNQQALALLTEALRLYPRDPRLHQLQAQDLCRARQALAAAPGAGRGLRAAGQPAGGDRAAAARAQRRRRRLLPALGGGCAPEGAARAARARSCKDAQALAGYASSGGS